MDELMPTDLPASAFCSAEALKVPTPLVSTASLAVRAANARESGAIDVPPGLYARNSSSSSLNVVGLSSTCTPFDSVHVVTPTFASCVSVTTRPGSGCRATSGALDTESTYAATCTWSTLSARASSAASPGTDALSFDGALATMVRSRSESQ